MKNLRFHLNFRYLLVHDSIAFGVGNTKKARNVQERFNRITISR